VNDDLSIYATRGDIVFFSVTAEEDGQPYEFQPGDVLRIKVYGKKNAENVVLQKDFGVKDKSSSVDIFLTEADTKIGGVISKPTDYWYEVELNPFDNPQTIVGYDEDGAKLLRLFPEGADVPEYVPEPEDIPVVDLELDMTSTRPVQNQAIARAVVGLRGAFAETKKDITTKAETAVAAATEATRAVAVERARLDAVVALKEGSTTGDAELQDIRVDANGVAHNSAGDAVRGQYLTAKEMVESVTVGEAHNLFDPTDSIRGGAVSDSGDLLADERYWRTGLINIAGVAELVCNYRPYKIVFLDESNAVSGAVSSVENLNPIAVPSGASYAVYQFENDRVSFDERYEVIINSGEYIDVQKRYLINPEAIGGDAVALLRMLEVDTKNLFEPLHCADGRAFSNAGEYFESTDYWCSGYIPVSDTAGVVANFKPHKLVWLDSEKVFISADTEVVALNKCAKPTGAAYLRIQVAAETVPFAERFALCVCGIENNITDALPRYTIMPEYIAGDIAAKLEIFSCDQNNLLNPAKCQKEAAFASGTGGIFASATYWLSDFIPVSGVTAISSNKTIYKYGWFDAEKNILAVNTEAPEDAAYLLLQFKEEKVPYDSRFEIIVCDAAVDIAKVNPYFYIRKAVVEDKSINTMGEYRFSIPLATTPYMSDHTFINGQLYVINASSDDHAEYSSVTVYDVDAESEIANHVRTFKHNLGHANSIDYCEGNGCLILGNGSNDSSLPGEIYILPDAANKDTWEYADCIKIDVSGEEWGIKTNVVWGDHNNGAYNIAYVITNNNANIRKLLLTKTSGMFDGGYIVLNEWVTGSVDVNQGTVYRNGKLYIGIGHSQLWVLEYTLNADGSVTVKQSKDIFYDEAGTILTNPFTEGITVEDGYLYIGASSGDILVYKMR
jgi:hypothetical protein